MMLLLGHGGLKNSCKRPGPRLAAPESRRDSNHSAQGCELASYPGRDVRGPIPTLKELHNRTTAASSSIGIRSDTMQDTCATEQADGLMQLFQSWIFSRKLTQGTRNNIHNVRSSNC